MSFFADFLHIRVKNNRELKLGPGMHRVILNRTMRTSIGNFLHECMTGCNAINRTADSAYAHLLSNFDQTTYWFCFSVMSSPSEICEWLLNNAYDTKKHFLRIGFRRNVFCISAQYERKTICVRHYVVFLQCYAFVRPNLKSYSQSDLSPYNIKYGCFRILLHCIILLASFFFLFFPLTNLHSRSYFTS